MRVSMMSAVAIAVAFTFSGLSGASAAESEGMFIHQSGSEQPGGQSGENAGENAKVWQAETWAKDRNSPWLTRADSEMEKKKHKGPVRSIIKGLGKELGTSGVDFAKDMMLVFSVQDIDPYEKKGVPKNRPAIVLKCNMVDGTSTYLRRFPDGSYAVEDGFADGTVLIPRKEDGDYLVKYPNGVKGRMVKEPGGNVKIYRPDKTVTTFDKTTAGGYSVHNTKFGFMGEARPDRTGVNYEVGTW